MKSSLTVSRREMMEIKLSLSSLMVTQVSGLCTASNHLNVIEAQSQAPVLEMAHGVDHGRKQQSLSLPVAPKSAILPSSCKTSNKVTRTRNQYTTLWSNPTWLYNYKRAFPLWEYQIGQRQRYIYTEEWQLEDLETLQESHTTIQLPLWLIRRRYCIHWQNVISGWDFKLRSYPIVPCNAPIMNFCRFGDLKGVQKLLQDRSASAFDTDINGYTPLHASFSPQIQLSF